MNTLKFKQMLRWSLLSAGGIALFWMIYYIIRGFVPVSDTIRWSRDNTIMPPFTLSRWWDIMMGPIFSVFVVSILNSNRSKKDEDEDWYTGFNCDPLLVLVAGLILGLIIGLDLTSLLPINGCLMYSVLLMIIGELMGLGFLLTLGLAIGFGVSLRCGLVVGLGFSLIFLLLWLLGKKLIIRLWKWLMIR